MLKKKCCLASPKKREMESKQNKPTGFERHEKAKKV